MQDKVIVCKDCGQEFTFTVGEQEFYKEKGFDNEPVRWQLVEELESNKTTEDSFVKLRANFISSFFVV